MKFADDFLWGTATASYQVEGASREDGRGESIWDVFCRTPGRVYAGQNGDVACDQYHRYPEDVRLMADIGIKAYRFSIAWPRIIPSGSGAVNQKGLDYYRRLAEELQRHNITPAATLYHWDLPTELQEQHGGWVSRDTAYRFAEYSEVCFRELSDLIPMWITLNEPWCSARLGYRAGNHAPGHTSDAEMVRAIHHLNLAHGLAVQCGRTHGGKDIRIGTTLNTGVIRPATRSAADAEHADRFSDDSRMYLWPLFGRGYPQRYVDFLASQLGAPLPTEAEDDLQQIAQPIDFLGFNYYMEFVTTAPNSDDQGANSGIVTDDSGKTGDQAASSKEEALDDIMAQFNLQPRWEPTTAMGAGWHISPAAIYRHLKWIKNEIGDIPIYITENGCACDDVVTADGRVHDRERIAYIHGHLQQVERAIGDGIDVRGYFAWSLIDNFEWAYGYEKRFGIVYCDYATLKRIPKDSYYFYRDCIAGYID